MIGGSGAVVAAETFADLRTIATERAPFFFTPGIIRRAFDLRRAAGHFRVDAVSPVIAAARITATRAARPRRCGCRHSARAFEARVCRAQRAEGA